MENEIDETTEENDVSKDSKRKSYPVRELSYIIGFVAAIYEKLGVNLHHSREDIAKVHGLVVQTIGQVLSTCQQYGLLELKHGTGYKITSLFIKVHRPLNDSERIQGITECLRSCIPFSKLIDDYNGHSVPTISGITNNLVRSFKLKENIALRVAELFISNMKEYNFIDSKNELRVLVQGTQTQTGTSRVENPAPPVQPSITPPNESNIVIPIPLKSTGKKAYLHLPDGYTDADLNRISKFVNALKDEDEVGK